ncbi:hypothetical protein [Alkalihalobacillus pseudalcaliphilus]|uniref:hypothetical protein n=1 Tax=Alkalihalobacillus pseudalcaliphilus TaxID=79884 RepID=UPI00064D765F|nr:hypothetical protein [Alkalihalobacillus pseudalcaliphilus]KMK77025.1 hypothetical protein AB990_05570 [Alkalihalobacillus pseudalcaliphilus]
MVLFEVTSTKLGEIKSFDQELICEQIEQQVRLHKLIVTQKTTLVTKKGSFHWHFKRESEKGVLEITYWPKHGSLTLEVANNRKAEWNIRVAEQLATSFAQQFQGTLHKNKKP